MNNGTDYYKILGVEPGATDQEIKAAYRKGALAFHPDRNIHDPEAADKMKALNEAYAVLSDRTKRAKYDSLKHRFGEAAYSHFRQSYSYQDIFAGSDIESIFEELARSFGLRGFDDIFRNAGGDSGFRSFTFGDSGFSGRSYVFTKTFRQEGTKASARSSPVSRGTMKLAGRLLRKITGLDLPVAGEDIKDRLSISERLASEGGTVEYFVKKRNKKLIVKIPPGVREGQQIRLAGMGGEGRGGAPPGDVYLTIKVQKPFLEKATSLFLWFFK